MATDREHAENLIGEHRFGLFSAKLIELLSHEWRVIYLFDAVVTVDGTSEG